VDLSLVRSVLTMLLNSRRFCCVSLSVDISRGLKSLVATALASAFKDPYKGGALRDLKDELDAMIQANLEGEKCGPLYLTFSTGKSRTVDELAKERITFQFNLRNDSNPISTAN
jgi:hypothetical protein